MDVPRVGVEPHPGGMPDLHVADHTFFVIGDDAPGVGIHQADQRLVRDRLVADPKRQVGGCPVGRRQHLGLIELPLQVPDFGSDGLDRRVVQRLHLALLINLGLGVGQGGGCFLRIGRRGIERLARQKAGVSDRLGAPQIVIGQPGLSRGGVARRLCGFDEIVVDRKLCLGLGSLRLLLGKVQSKRYRVDLREQGALAHGLVVGDRDGDDAAGNLRSDGDEIGGHVGVVGVGEDIARPPIKRERRGQPGEHQQDAASVAARRRDRRIDDDPVGERAQHRRRGARQPRLHRGGPVAKRGI